MRFLSTITLLVALGVMLGTMPEIGNAQRSDKPMSSEGSLPGGNLTLNSVIGDNDERVSFVAPLRDAFEPDIAYNPQPVPGRVCSSS